MSTIRHAVSGDARAIAALWNPLIRDTPVTFAAEAKSESEVVDLIAARPGAFFVAERDGVLGFASFAQFRPGAGYAHTMEHTIILGPAARGRGLGRRLMDRIVKAARAKGAHVLVAAISGENPGAVGFHAAMGFEAVGRMPEVGFKFGRRFDLVLMQRRL